MRVYNQFCKNISGFVLFFHWKLQSALIYLREMMKKIISNFSTNSKIISSHRCHQIDRAANIGNFAANFATNRTKPKEKGKLAFNKGKNKT